MIQTLTTSLPLLLSCVIKVPTTTEATSTLGGLGVPGTTQTLSGYDTEFGIDPICWKGRSILTATPDELLRDGINANNTSRFYSPLFNDFILFGKTELLQTCPSGTYVKGVVPEIFGSFYENGTRIQSSLEDDDEDRIFRPRTNMEYNYTVYGSIVLNDEMMGNKITSNNATVTQRLLNRTINVPSSARTLISLQVLLCDQITSGFCSPFVHEQANRRENTTSKLETPTTGDRHGGTHVHSQYYFVEIRHHHLTDNNRYDFNVSIPVRVNMPGTFFAITALSFFTTDVASPNSPFIQSTQPYYRYDVANAFNLRLISYQEPVVVLDVSSASVITMCMLSGIASIAILALLFFCIKHRNNRILQLTQGNIIIVYLIAAFIPTCTIFLFEPKNDTYCNAVQPIMLIPIQLMFSILVGRLWRINTVISPLLDGTYIAGVKSKKKRLSITSFLFDVISCMAFLNFNAFSNDKERSTRNLRVQVKNKHLCRIMMFLTLPQAIMQILSLAIQPHEVIIQLNEDESTGSTHCGATSSLDNGSDVPIGRSIGFYALLMLVLLSIVTVIVATHTRKLPSLLNETHQLYDATLLSSIVIVLSIVVIVVTESPSTSPDIQYIVSGLAVLSLTLNMSLRIVLPKLVKIWNGETILISTLVADHKLGKNTRESTNHTYNTPNVASSMLLDGSSDQDQEQNVDLVNGDNRLQPEGYCDEGDRNYDDNDLDLDACMKQMNGVKKVQLLETGSPPPATNNHEENGGVFIDTGRRLPLISELSQCNGKPNPLEQHGHQATIVAPRELAAVLDNENSSATEVSVDLVEGGDDAKEPSQVSLDGVGNTRNKQSSDGSQPLSFLQNHEIDLPEVSTEPSPLATTNSLTCTSDGVGDDLTKGQLGNKLDSQEKTGDFQSDKNDNTDITEGFRVGDRVALQGLKRGTQHNGRTGTIIKDFDITSGRYSVSLDFHSLLDGPRTANKVPYILVKPNNIIKIADVLGNSTTRRSQDGLAPQKLSLRQIDSSQQKIQSVVDDQSILTNNLPLKKIDDNTQSNTTNTVTATRINEDGSPFEAMPHLASNDHSITTSGLPFSLPGALRSDNGKVQSKKKKERDISRRRNSRKVWIDNAAVERKGGGQSADSLTRPGQPLSDSSIRSDRLILVTNDTLPSKNLLVRMIDTQNILQLVNTQILNGKAPDYETWHSLQRNLIKMGLIFDKQVKLNFGQDDSDEKFSDDEVNALI